MIAKLVLAVGALFLVGIFPTAGPASARGGCSSSEVSTGTTQGGFQGSAEDYKGCGNNNNSDLPESNVPGVWHHKPACLGGATTCDAEGIEHCDNGQAKEWIWFQPTEGPPSTAFTNCPDTDEPDLGPSLPQIISAFRSIHLPESELVIEPPDGETLVNFRTNFLTVAPAFDRTVTLLGHDVDFRIKATAYTWHYGDGTSETTHSPGGRYPNLDNVHEYTRKGRVSPSVDTTWSADYRVDNGPWAPVPDTVTITGDAQSLRVRTATPVLVASG